MINKLPSFLEQYLTRKIGAEIKCCLTFLLILCFYCIFRWSQGNTEANMIHMFEMIWIAYILEWIQVLMHADFDEVDHLSRKEWMLILMGSALYGTLGHLLGWFTGNIAIAIFFFIYMICAYLCTFWVYHIKRSIDAKMLNQDLKHFHERRLQEMEEAS